MGKTWSAGMVAFALVAAMAAPATSAGLLERVGDRAKQAGVGIKQGLNRAGDEIREDLCKVGNVVRSDERDRQCEPTPPTTAGAPSPTVPSPKPVAQNTVATDTAPIGDVVTKSITTPAEGGAREAETGPAAQ